MLRIASHRGAANDLRRHGLAVDGGRTRGNEEVRILTAAGLAAAATDLDREPEEMGGIPKGAGRSGASHPMTVNETAIALIRPKPDLDLVAGEPAEAVAAARAAVDAPDGIGTLTSYATEVALPVKGTLKNPAIGSARADIVLVAPDDGVPLLFIEADNCTEEAALIAAKFDKYLRFFHRQEKDTDDTVKPMWRTRWSAPPWDEYEQVHPPVLLVFHQVGKRSAKNQMERVADLTRSHWQGCWYEERGYHSYDGCIPIVATTLERLREHGPAGPAFWRYGRDRLEPLLDAIGNPRRDAALARRRQAAREREGAVTNGKPPSGRRGGPSVPPAERSSPTTAGSRSGRPGGARRTGCADRARPSTSPGSKPNTSHGARRRKPRRGRRQKRRRGRTAAGSAGRGNRRRTVSGHRVRPVARPGR
ncbi:replication-relaxation family protein [Streptomyces sp. NPDC003860]